MESTYQTAISSTQISEERVVAPPPPALAVEATAGMTEPQHEFVFAPLHSTAAQGPASKQRSAVLMELYDERSRVLTELRKAGVALQTGARDIAIGENGVSYVNWRGQTRTVGCDHVILAKGAQGDLTLANELRSAGFKVHVAGDCRGVGYIDGAMNSAAEVAQAI